MNSYLQQMIRCQDPSRRAKLAILVQADIERVGKGYLEVVERQHQLVNQLLVAGLTHIPGTEETISLDHITDEVEARKAMGRKGHG